MNKFLSFVLSLLCLSCWAQGSFEVYGVRLGRPCDEVIKDFGEKGFVTIAKPETGTIMIGDLPGFEQALLVIQNKEEICHFVSFMKVCEGSPVEAYDTYEQVNSMISSLYGVKGKEIYKDNYSPYIKKNKAEKADAIAAGEFAVMCMHEVDNGDVITLLSKQEAGVTIAVSFADEECVQEIESLDSENEKKEEKKAGIPTRFKGISISRSLKEVKNDLVKLGFKEAEDSSVRALFKKQNMVRLTGDFFGSKDCNITLIYGDYEGEDYIQVLCVDFPSCKTWRQLYEKYLNVRSSIVEKYGIDVTFEDSVNGKSDNLLGMDNYEALRAIQNNNHNLEAFMLNPEDYHAFKIVPSCIEVYGEYTYYVSLYYFTPLHLMKEVNKSDDL